MLEEVIEELTRMMIKDNFENGTKTIKITKTDAPKTMPAEDKLGFGKVFSDHMFIMDYEKEKGWQELVYESGNMYTKETELFASAILSGTEAPVSADDAIRDQRVVEAVYESYENKNYIVI